MDIRLIPAPISIQLSLDDGSSDSFKREFDSFSESDDDAIGQWLKLAKARGETKDSDPVLLLLVTELHRKLDQVLSKLDKSERELIELPLSEEINGINFDYFSIKRPILVPLKKYYGRISMPTFPKRDVAIYFRAIEKNIAQIELLHQRDRKEWNGYVTSRERAMIREMKEKNDSAN